MWSLDIPHKPTPAEKSLPNWYKETPSYLPEGFPTDSSVHPVKGTIKKCTPVFDVLISGYMLYTPYDVIVSQINGNPYYEWYAPNSVVEFHPVEQAGNHPAAHSRSIPKWHNPWSIKTQEGYSIYISHPAHREDLPFTTMSAIVDTDKFNSPVHFIFTLKNPSFEGLIPAGTPMAQILPFKRERWEMKFGTEKDKEFADNQAWRLYKLKEFRYKYAWWTKKEYK
jgi:hypothetical protein